MKVIIAGSRKFTKRGEIMKWIDLSKFNITEVVSGASCGVDWIGEQWGLFEGKKIKRFPANWDKFNKAAGPIRNKQMARYADALILIWDGKSKGSSNMKANAKKYKLPIEEIIL